MRSSVHHSLSLSAPSKPFWRFRRPGKGQGVPRPAMPNNTALPEEIDSGMILFLEITMTFRILAALLFLTSSIATAQVRIWQGTFNLPTYEEASLIRTL